MGGGLMRGKVMLQGWKGMNPEQHYMQQQINRRFKSEVGDVPFFVEHCEAVAAKIYVKRRWLGKQGRHVSFCSGGLPERHVTLEVACATLVVGSLWPLPA